MEFVAGIIVNIKFDKIHKTLLQHINVLSNCNIANIDTKESSRYVKNSMLLEDQIITIIH